MRPAGRRRLQPAASGQSHSMLAVLVQLTLNALRCGVKCALHLRALADVRERRLQDLLHEDTVQGSLRRALDSIEGLDLDLARTASIEPKHLKDFYWGDAELSGEEIDRLARALHLQLVPSDH